VPYDPREGAIPGANEPGRGPLPDALVALIAEKQLGGFKDGLLWFVDPSRFNVVADEFAPGTHMSVFAHTAFADLIGWTERNHVRQRDSGSRSNDRRSQYLPQYTIVSDNFVKGDLKKSVIDNVVRRLAPVGKGQCYAFVSALPLGGDGTPESVQVAGLMEHLNFLPGWLITSTTANSVLR
jgi:hypothetical protein